MAGGLKKEVEKEVVATQSTKQEEAVAPVAEAVVEAAPVAGFHSRDFTSK